MMRPLRLLLSSFVITVTASCSNLNIKETPNDKKSQHFEATAESLKQYECPKWFRDVKFGIYIHWGPYSVAEQGEWYSRRLYLQGTKEYKHHLENYGHPSKHGYKDFIPEWKAEKFDADALLALFKKSGAKYFTPCAVHHDNFDLWDSKYNKWNAVNMGPKRDIIREFEQATKKVGLKFGVTTHLSRSYSFMNVANQSDKTGPKAGVPYDGAQGKGKGFYPPVHDDIHQRAPINAPKEWRDHWANRIKDLVDNYEIDHLYFDCAIPFRGDDQGKTGMDVISHYYNVSAERNDGVNQSVMCIKERPWQGFYDKGVATLDFERGKANHILEDAWQTDDSMGSWGYDISKPYTTAGTLVDKIIDIVSKNGNMLLNVPIKADGTLDSTATNILLDIGKWMDVNGEAIYGTRPWYIYGEGHTALPHFTVESPFTYKDVRYTTKGDVLYAFALAAPKGKKQPITFQLLTDTNPKFKAYKNVEMLGYKGNLRTDRNVDGFKIYLPEESERPCDYAYVFKFTKSKESVLKVAKK